MQCSISLYYQTGESPLSYSKTLVWSDSAETQFIPGVRKSESTLDFEDSALVYEHLLKRHATSFTSQLLGLPGRESIEISRPSDDCLRAIKSYNRGNMRGAAREATSAIQNDKTRKYNAYFVKGLAMAKNGDLDMAHGMFLMAIRFGREVNISTRDFERGLLVLDQLRENGGEGWDAPGPMVSPILGELSEATRTLVAKEARQRLRKDGINATPANLKRVILVIVEESLRKTLKDK